MSTAKTDEPTDQARSAYSDAIQTRTSLRSRLPQEIPTDKTYREKILEAQYIKSRVQSPNDVKAVDEYTRALREQHKASQDLKKLDKHIPKLLAQAEAEAEYENQYRIKQAEAKAKAKAEAEKKKAEEKRKSVTSGYDSKIASLQSQIASVKEAREKESKREVPNVIVNKSNPVLGRLRQKQKELKNYPRIAGRNQLAQQQKKDALIKEVARLEAEHLKVEQVKDKQTKLSNYTHQIKDLEFQLSDVQRKRSEAVAEYNAKQKRESKAKSAVTSATTERAYKEAIWRYRDSEFVSSRKLTAPYMTPEVSKALAQHNRAKQLGLRGRTINRTGSKAEYLFMGGTSSNWNEIIKREDANRKIALRQSAGLRASGNAQIKVAQGIEMKRLGAQQTATGWANPTKVSNTLTKGTNVANRVPVAQGTALKAQDFGKGYTAETKAFGYVASGQAEVDRQKQMVEYERNQILKSQGLDPSVKAGGYDSVVASGQLGTGFRNTTAKESKPAPMSTIITPTKSTNPVQGMTVNQSIVQQNKTMDKIKQSQIRKGGIVPPVSVGTIQEEPVLNITTKSRPNERVTSTDYRTAVANARQTQYVNELRSGNVGLATALMNPQTKQSYEVKGNQVPRSGTSINLRTFLKEGGYDLTKPDEIPNDVFKPVKYEKARSQASEATNTGSTMGNLEKLVPESPKASDKVIQQRTEARQRWESIKPQTLAPAEYNSNEALMNSASFNTVKKLETGKVEINKPLPEEQKGQSYFGVMPSQIVEDRVYDYTVPSNEKIDLPLLDGKSYQAYPPVTFDTKKEAEDYIRSKPKEKVFSGTGNVAWDTLQFMNAVDAGERVHPSKTPSLIDDYKYYASAWNAPTVTIASQVANLVLPEDKKIPVREVASGHLIGGTIDDVLEGQPFKGTGVTRFGQYVATDPLRATLQAPQEVALGWLGGKAIQGGTSLGGKAVTRIAQSPKTPAPVVEGIVTTQRGIEKIKSVPEKVGSAVYDYGTVMRGTQYGTKVFTPSQQAVRYGIVKPYDKLTMFQGSHVGFDSKVNLMLTRGGRLFVKQADDIGYDIGAKPQFVNKNIVKYETEDLTAFATRGKVKTVEATMPKAKPFESDVFAPTKEFTPIVKAPINFDRIGYTRIGTPTPPTIKSPTIKSPVDTDRLRYTTVGQKSKDVKKVKTAIDEITFYSDTTGDVIKTARPSKAEIQGELDNFKIFDKPTITGTRETIQTFKTSTSRTSLTGELKYSEMAGGKIKIKGKPIREIDTIATGAKVKGKDNLKIIDDLVEDDTLEEVGKKTVVKGTDYFAGGKQVGKKRSQLKQTLESKSATYYQTASGKFMPKDETTLYTVNKKVQPVDKKAFERTMKYSPMLKKMKEYKDEVNKITGGLKPQSPPNITEIPKGVSIQPSGKPPVTNTSRKSSTSLVQKPQSTPPLSRIADKTQEQTKKTSSKSSALRSGYTSAYIGNAYVDPIPVDNNIDNVNYDKIRVGQPTRIKEIPLTTSVQKIGTNVGITGITDTSSMLESAQVSKQAIKQQSKLNTSQETKLNTKQQSRLKNTVQPKLATRQRQRVSPKISVKFATPLKTPITKGTTKRPVGLYLPPELVEKKKKKKKTKSKKRVGFIGNVRLDSVLGVYKRRDITYGEKKVKRLEKQDKQVSKKTTNMLSMPPASALKKTGRKKKKTQNILGYTFPKSKKRNLTL